MNKPDDGDQSPEEIQENPNPESEEGDMLQVDKERHQERLLRAMEAGCADTNGGPHTMRGGYTAYRTTLAPTRTAVPDPANGSSFIRPANPSAPPPPSRGGFNGVPKHAMVRVGSSPPPSTPPPDSSGSMNPTTIGNPVPPPIPSVHSPSAPPPPLSVRTEFPNTPVSGTPVPSWPPPPGCAAEPFGPASGVNHSPPSRRPVVNTESDSDDDDKKLTQPRIEVYPEMVPGSPDDSEDPHTRKTHVGDPPARASMKGSAPQRPPRRQLPAAGDVMKEGDPKLPVPKTVPAQRKKWTRRSLPYFALAGGVLAACITFVVWMAYRGQSPTPPQPQRRAIATMATAIAIAPTSSKKKDDAPEETPPLAAPALPSPPPPTAEVVTAAPAFIATQIRPDEFITVRADDKGTLKDKWDCGDKPVSTSRVLMDGKEVLMYHMHSGCTRVAP